MESLIAFFGGIVGSWVFLSVAFFCAIMSEVSYSFRGSIFFAILVAISALLLFSNHLPSISTVGVWAIIIGYIVGGFIYSLWRWFRYTGKATEIFNEQISGSQRSYDAYVRDYNRNIDFRYNLDKISFWVIAWPISGAAQLTGDLVLVVKKVISNVLANLFDKISENARKKVVLIESTSGSNDK